MSDHDYRERMHSAAQHLENAASVQVYMAALEAELDLHRRILRILARSGPLVISERSLRRVAELPPLRAEARPDGGLIITVSP